MYISYAEDKLQGLR